MMTKGGGGFKNLKKLMMSFMNGPKARFNDIIHYGIKSKNCPLFRPSKRSKWPKITEVHSKCLIDISCEVETGFCWNMKFVPFEKCEIKWHFKLLRDRSATPAAGKIWKRSLKLLGKNPLSSQFHFTLKYARLGFRYTAYLLYFIKYYISIWCRPKLCGPCANYVCKIPWNYYHLLQCSY